MYELNSELLDGYLHLVDISTLRTPFIKDNKLKDKYSRGFRPQKLQMDRLSLAYSSDNSDLNHYLRRVVTGVMEQDVLKTFKKNEIALDEIDNIDDDFLKRFAAASKDILTPDYYSQKCAAIIDFFNITYTQSQIDILDFIFRTNTVAALKKAEEFDQCVENHKQEMANIIKDNQLEIQALTQERVELYENIKKNEEQIEILASELDETRKINQKHEARIRQFDQSQEYINIQNPNVVVSFCIYGTYIAPSNEQYTVAYRIADIYKNKLNPLNEPKVRYVKLDSLTRSKQTVGKCGIWEFAPPNTFGSEYSGALNIYEIIFSNNEIKEFGENYTLLGEQFGNGIEIDLDGILTEDFLLVIRERNDQYWAILSNKRQWKQMGSKSKLTDFEHLYTLTTVNKHMIFTQENNLVINGTEYIDRKLITHTNEGFSILKKVDLIFLNEVLKKAISKTKNIYDLTKSERQKMRHLIDEIFTRDEDRYKKLLEEIMIGSQEYDQLRENLLKSGLETVEDKLNDWDEYFSLLIANHPKLYCTFANAVEKEWQKANSDRIEATNEKLKEQTAALTEAKEAYELANTETKQLEERRSSIAAQIESMNDDICDAVEKASSEAVKIIANGSMLEF